MPERSSSTICWPHWGSASSAVLSCADPCDCRWRRARRASSPAARVPAVEVILFLVVAEVLFAHGASLVVSARLSGPGPGNAVTLAARPANQTRARVPPDLGELSIPRRRCCHRRQRFIGRLRHGGCASCAPTSSRRRASWPRGRGALAPDRPRRPQVIGAAVAETQPAPLSTSRARSPRAASARWCCPPSTPTWRARSISSMP